MRFFGIIVSILATFFISGCASSPNWRNDGISDKAVASRQLIIDDGSCTLVASGGAPMPEFIPVEGPKTSEVTIRGATYNTTTGSATSSFYRGKVTTSPSGGFAGGLASGMASGANLGAAIAARKAQDRIYKACMYTKGWVDAPVKAAGLTTAPEILQTVKRAAEPSANFSIYKTQDEEWLADLDEFLRFNPDYKQPALYDALRLQMIEVGKDGLKLNMPQKLLAVHEKISGQKLVGQEKADSVLAT